MSRKILVLGGTRFFGKRLVEKLAANGDDVTIATRGQQEDSFGDQVTRVKVDRSERESMEIVFNRTKWDLIYDQICFSPDDAKIACDVFKEKTRHYVMTSTLSVYGFDEKELKIEKDFDPYTYEITMGGRADFSYGEGKRLAESVFFQEASFPVTAVRPPIVLGEDDYTERLHFHLEKVLKEVPVLISNVHTKLSFVEAGDLADFLFWTGKSELHGPVNASSPDQVSLGKLIAMIEQETGREAKIAAPESPQNQSPFNFPASTYQDVSLAEASGYTFKPLTSWLPQLINHIHSLYK
ncbi:NAD-dependent epimerase/dehydratase family protein [Alteribacter keqinensis]|uniref:NAD-dependent epimerase/dehydratase family protein n=1 Tax=Alteribacter keqinensis TaxID=2483800 RepID=A0A3M7TTV4_9BACI|nr:NAD-dependent epimerase/dehydratase family protein [Alteribacter keqinensis]RNA68651.1 NAD-dependent epimerase/dehydratase family protein [Alteribacter keqinensis]